MKSLLLGSALCVTALLLSAIGLSLRGGERAGAQSQAANAAARKARDASPVIVELFTSEGCSSCPPADRVLAQLAEEQPVEGAEIIALSEHVDYWNYIGWTDPFSQAAFSARQESYAGVFQRDQIYTPQMVVDGQAEFNGSNASRAREAIARLARAPKAEVKLAQTVEPDLLKLRIEIDKTPQATAGDIAEVLLAVTESNLASQVARGENAGRRLPHVAVVRELRGLGRIDPAARTFRGETTVLLPAEWKRADLRVVALVQERAHRRILGAAQLAVAAQ